MAYRSVSEVARQLRVAPRIISDLFYARWLSDDVCPLVGGRRLIPDDYVGVIARVLRERGLLEDGTKGGAAMIKLPEKDSFSPAELARAVGKHCATIWRWMVRGVRGHRLASYRLGGQRRIAREDILAFIEAINSDTAINGSAKGETPRRAEEVRRVEDELDRLGI